MSRNCLYLSGWPQNRFWKRVGESETLERIELSWCTNLDLINIVDGMVELDGLGMEGGKRILDEGGGERVSE